LRWVVTKFYLHFEQNMTGTPYRSRSRLRIAIETVVCFIMAMLILQTWFIDGLAIPRVVSSGSMANTLLGPHQRVVCPDCGFTFSCDVAQKPVKNRAVCPNCGYVNTALKEPLELDGDRLLINRWVYDFRRPRRWEIVAFHRSPDAEKVLVKRVIGLPGETVEIRDGDVYIDGEILRKKLIQQMTMSVMVHDNSYLPTLSKNIPLRWETDVKDSEWTLSNGRLIHPEHAEDERKSTIDWIAYKHWRRMPGQMESVEETPITDLVGYNQSTPRYEEDVHQVNDLMIYFKMLNLSNEGSLYIRAIVSKRLVWVELDPRNGSYRIKLDNQEILRKANNLPIYLLGKDVIISTFDHQLILSIGGRPIISQPIDELEGLESSIDSNTQQFAIGARNLGIEISDLKVLRDIYYTEPLGPKNRWATDKPLHLGVGQYFVLGDNSPISEDSRTWPEHPTVNENQILGKAFFIMYRSRPARLGEMQFQVADFTRIGYIR
jgi:signal peptidase I